MSNEQVPSWSARATATAGAATATKAATAEEQHIITQIQAGYVHATQTGTLTIAAGADTLAVIPIVGAGICARVCFRADVNEALTATLSAGAGGVVGHVNIQGTAF